MGSIGNCSFDFRYCDGARKKKVDISEQSLVRRYGKVGKDDD